MHSPHTWHRHLWSSGVVAKLFSRRQLGTGGVPALIAALKREAARPSCAAVAAAACGAASRLAVGHQACAAIAAAGGVQDAIDALKAHMSNADTAARTCSFVTHIAEADVDHITPAIASAGVMEAMVGALETHASSMAVAAPASKAISILAHDSSNAAAIAAVGGATALVSALHTHTSVAEVTRPACRAIGLLTVDPEPARAVAQAGAIPALVGALEVPRVSFDTKGDSLFALRNMARRGDDNQSAIAAAGGIPATVETLRTHKASTPVTLHACHVLRDMGSSNERVAALVGAGAAQVAASISDVPAARELLTTLRSE